MASEIVEKQFAYVGMCKCGGVVHVSCDTPECAKDNAKWLAKLVRSGHTVSRHEYNAWRKLGVEWCSCGDKKPATVPVTISGEREA